MKEEKLNPKKAADEIQGKRIHGKRIEFVITYVVEGSKSKKHKVHAYSREEAMEIMTKKLESQISSGEINGYKIISAEIEN
jgi:hypothetical protein